MRDTVQEERVLLKVQNFIAPKVLIFQFYQYNLKLYKLILPYAKYHNHPSKINNPKLSRSFCSKFLAAEYGFFFDKINLLR